jgi:hypothetical protein
VIANDCEELTSAFTQSAAFASLTLPYEAAQQISRSVGGTDKSIEIIYVGDYDPAGVRIDVDIEAKLRKHLIDDFSVTNRLTFHSLAITRDQISAYRLPTMPRKTGDRRALHIADTVEAEAMPAHMLRRLLREKVENFMPEGALSTAGQLKSLSGLG